MVVDGTFRQVLFELVTCSSIQKRDLSLSQRLLIAESRLICPEDEWADCLSEPYTPPEDSLRVFDDSIPVIAVVESESACEVEQSVRSEAVECQQCEKSNQSDNPSDRHLDRSSDSIVTKSDLDRSRLSLIHI